MKLAKIRRQWPAIVVGLLSGLTVFATLAWAQRGEDFIGVKMYEGWLIAGWPFRYRTCDYNQYREDIVTHYMSAFALNLLVGVVLSISTAIVMSRAVWHLRWPPQFHISSVLSLMVVAAVALQLFLHRDVRWDTIEVGGYGQLRQGVDLTYRPRAAAVIAIAMALTLWVMLRAIFTLATRIVRRCRQT